MRIRWFEELEQKWEKFWFPFQPEAGTAAEWAEYHRTIKKHKVKYFLVETLPDFIRRWVFWPVHKIDEVIWYFRHRFSPTYQYHLINTKLEPGYHDIDHRMLHGMMEMLVNYVEECLSSKNGSEKVEAGLEHLDWMISLNDSNSNSAKEAKEIYLWWKNVYPNRPDPYDASGWTKICENRRKKSENFWEQLDFPQSGVDKEDHDRALKKVNEIELAYDKEDEEMLIRLVKIRKYLW